MSESRRAASRAGRDVHKETLVSPAPPLGLVALAGPADPEPTLVVENGRVVVNKRPRGRPPKHPRPVLEVDEVPIPPHLVA